MAIANKGEVRSPVTWAILSLCCIPAIILVLGKWPKEFNRALGEDKYAWWMFISPILNIIKMFQMTQDLEVLQDKAGVKDKTSGILVFLMFIIIWVVGIYLMQNTLNKCWEA